MTPTTTTSPEHVSALGAVIQYYRSYSRVRTVRLPQTLQDLPAWCLWQIGEMWNTKTNIGIPFGIFLARGGEARSAMVASQRTVKAVIALWPLLSIPLSRTQGLLNWTTNWKIALRRPDLILALGVGPWDESDAESLTTPLINVAVGHFQYLHSRSQGFFIDNKRRFAEEAGKRGFPVVKCLAREELRPDMEYIVKPALESQGRGIRLVYGSDVLENVDLGKYIVQERATNHEAIRAVTGDEAALSTLRLETIQTRNSGAIVIISGFRMGMPGSIVDNVHAGGLDAPVDLETGVVLSAATLEMSMRSWKHGYTIEHHPATNERFAGSLVLPYFQEAKTLCLRAHREICSDIFRVAWDVALTDDGPFLLEAGAALGGYCGYLDAETHGQYFETLKVAIQRSLDQEER